MSTLEVLRIVPFEGRQLNFSSGSSEGSGGEYGDIEIFVTGAVSASLGFDAKTGYVSGAVGKFTTAYIGTLDVDVINSATTTVTTLEVADYLIIAASGSTDTGLSDAGYQIGGYNTSDSSYNQPLASMIYANNSLSLNVTGSETPIACKLFLSGSGFVGIGVTDPDAPLEILSASSPQLKLSYDGTNYATFAVASDGQLDITTVDASAAAGHICFMPDGNVGIGTTSPAALTHLYKAALVASALPLEMLRLEVVDEGVDMAAGHGPGIDFYVGETGGSDHGGTLAVVREIEGDADSAAAMVFHTAADDTTPAERMRITSAGDVGIGTADPAAKLDVAGHIFPAADSSYDLGSSSKRWRNIYTGDLHLKNERGDWTIVEEEGFLCVVNNKTGKKYEMMLKPIED